MTADIHSFWIHRVPNSANSHVEVLTRQNLEQNYQVKGDETKKSRVVGEFRFAPLSLVVIELTDCTG